MVGKTALYGIFLALIALEVYCDKAEDRRMQMDSSVETLAAFLVDGFKSDCEYRIKGDTLSCCTFKGTKPNPNACVSSKGLIEKGKVNLVVEQNGGQLLNEIHSVSKDLKSFCASGDLLGLALDYCLDSDLRNTPKGGFTYCGSLDLIIDKLKTMQVTFNCLESSKLGIKFVGEKHDKGIKIADLKFKHGAGIIKVLNKLLSAG